MRCPNCNDVKKKSDKDDVFCNYCLEALHSPEVFGRQELPYGIKMLQKVDESVGDFVPRGSIILWDAAKFDNVPLGFQDINWPTLEGYSTLQGGLQSTVSGQYFNYGNFQSFNHL